MPLFLVFLIVPIVEIGLFIQVGGWIGLWPTLGIVILTAALGAWMVRTQGRQALAGVRGSLSNLEDPTRPLAHGAMIIFSGALLLTPGFFTDAVGFALLVPAVRDFVMRRAGRRMTVGVMGGAGRPAPGGRPRPARRRPAPSGVIEGEWEEADPADPVGPGAAAGPRPDPGTPPSGWTRH
ncbi:UPF0716 protein FxsA [Hasllibacter halocynthiae]|uniref:UPF0716 protein FxsA n=1 Tax=Hasllibacter halocynthiae TaxID=595589 RepID=A0A2T0X2Q3_9RHOB|nr:FxsA family protein [Hasllibacter halocynthiae]PRY93134.1 UPF0716 protein FxsA [Hasllibacter halocynthiae]